MEGYEIPWPCILKRKLEETGPTNQLYKDIGASYHGIGIGYTHLGQAEKVLYKNLLKYSNFVMYWETLFIFIFMKGKMTKLLFALTSI